MEKLLQYVWQHRLWTATPMVTAEGERVDVIDPGLLNTDAGPDFFNAKVRIGDKLWVGNVEIHVRATDWHRHGHDSDRAYDTVILHVVGHSDGVITRPDGSVIPQVEMPCSPDFHKRYAELVNNRLLEPACAEDLRSLPAIYISDWVTSLALERLQRKAAAVASLAAAEGGDWQSAIYITLARTLGFHTNSDAFERLALATPLRRLRRHADQPFTVEAILFGQAGFLQAEAATPDDAAYIAELQREYRFMATKFGLQAPSSLGWRMSRMRPYHFPARTLAALAQFVSDGFTPGRELLQITDAAHARALFDIELRGYWARRFAFGPPTAHSARAFSSASLDVLVINVVVPAIYAYGMAYDKQELVTRAVEILTGIAPENNRKVRMFTDAGVACRDAFTSQALIELRNSYCEPRKCLYCRLGHRFLAARVRP